MSIPLRVLIVEDSPDDAEMMVLHLTDEGFQPEWRRVQTESDYLAALETNPDLILSDWSLPQFSGLRALQWVKERQLDIPFIIVSGTIGEDMAVEAMKQGSVDYLLKDRLARLGQAVAHALEQKRLRAENRQVEEKYRLIVENTVEGIFQSTPEGCYVTANPSLAQMLGYNSPAELIADATDLDHQFYVDPNRRQEFMRLLEEQETITGFESQIYRKDGNIVWVAENAHAVRDENGNLLYYEGTVLDITERKRAEDQIKASLAEKETLLREIHHRVKNNLEVVSSLLEMQARRSQDEQVRKEFHVSQQRILAMAQVHEQLYGSENLTQIDMEEYVTALTRGLLYTDLLFDVPLKVEIRDVNLDIDRAVPCGLIINELLTNALKYAFSADDASSNLPGGQHKEILVSMHPKNECYILKVSDNGAGLPDGLDVKSARTLGLRLVDRLTTQLHGDLQVMSQRGGGTTITISFPVSGER